MELIYEPRGGAREYAERACNIYKGCTHGCLYCFGPAALCMRDRKQDYYRSANPKTNVVERLKKDCAKLGPDTPEILLSFIGDPYQQAEMDLYPTRKVIQTLIAHSLSFTILTKGGMRAARDFDLLSGYPKARFGTTLIFCNQADVDHWEPGAAPVSDRIAAIKEAHGMGIPTWISLEPVIDPQQALYLIKELHPIVGHWKVGKINYNTELEARVDWVKFRHDVESLLKSVGADYYLKRSLTGL